MLGTILKRWNWLDNGLLPFALILMQAVCIAPLMTLVLQDPSAGIQETGYVFGLCIAVMLGGAVVGRLAHQNNLGSVMVAVGAVAACLIALLIVRPPDQESLGVWFQDVLYQITHISAERLPVSLITVLFTLFLWWRGLRSTAMGHGELVTAFGLGALVQLGLLFVHASRILWTAQSRVLVFVASSIAAFSLIQLARTFKEQKRHVGGLPQIDRYWLATVISVIVGVLLLGLILAELLFPGDTGFLAPLWRTILQIFLLIVFVLAYLFFSLIEPFLPQAASRRFAGESMTFQSFVLPTEAEQAEETALAVPHAWFEVMQVVIIALGIAFVIWLLVRALRRRKRTAKIEGVLENRESILTWDLLKTQLTDLLDSLRQRRAPPFLSLEGAEGDPRRIVRQVYQDLLALAIERGRPRSRGETPEVYLSKLVALCPQEKEYFKIITDSYISVRYGKVSPTAEQAQVILHAFSQIEVALEQAPE